jgi:cob(I)alamin adenosyltransferase
MHMSEQKKRKPKTIRAELDVKRERRAKIEKDLDTIQKDIFALCDELWIAEHGDDTAPLTYPLDVGF